MLATAPTPHVDHVVGVGPYPQMSGLYADGAITGVEDEQAMRDGADEDFMRGTMSQHVPLLVVLPNVGESAISLALDAVAPVPTAFGGRLTRHVLREKLSNSATVASHHGDEQRITVPSPPAPVGGAPTSGENWPVAKRASHRMIVAR